MKPLHILQLLLLVMVLLAAAPAGATSTKQEVINLQTEVASLREGQQEMQKELAEIKKLLQQGQKPAPSAAAFREQSVSFDQSPFKGQKDAVITLIEYSDYQCPFCSRHYRDVMPLLIKDYVDTGKMKYVMRENPISSIHKNAFDASLAALCAGDQNKYWEMHNVMFENQRELTVDHLKNYAADLGLATDEFNNCLDSRKHEKKVNADLASATRLGVQGTPGFLLGLTDPDKPDTARVSVYIKGAQAYDNFRANIEQLLESVN